MRKTIAIATVAASVAFGGLAGSVLGTPTPADAAETASGAASWMRDVLSSLVSDGTITQEQADSVEAALEEACPEGRFGSHRFGGHGRPSAGGEDQYLRSATHNNAHRAVVRRRS